MIVPLTHNALTKYTIDCQWCINSDLYEFEEYHKDKMVLIIQRKEIPYKDGLYGGEDTSEEIHDFQKYIDESYDMDYLQNIKNYDIDESNIENALKKLTSDYSNFRLSVVYYNIDDNNIVDMGNNYINQYGFTLNDIPNITAEVIDIIKEYKDSNI